MVGGPKELADGVRGWVSRRVVRSRATPTGAIRPAAGECGTGPPHEQRTPTAGGYAGSSSSVVAARPGSAKPRTHFSEALVLYFSA